MSNEYQAVYEAVRSRISNADIGSAVESAIRDMNCTHYVERAFFEVQSAAVTVCEQQIRPSALFRPTLSIDGNQWCALYGEDLQNGVAGFGESPEKAMAAFDAAWKKS